MSAATGVKAANAAASFGNLTILLPADRTRPGRFSLFAAGKDGSQGAPMITGPCLGRSAGLFDKVTGTVRRDRLQYRGDTPLGDYAVTFVSQLAKPITGIGSIWIGLDPVAGEALRAEQNGRRGLGIHGGRGNSRLMPTHGCVRLTDADMAALAKAAGRTRFTVTIREMSA